MASWVDDPSEFSLQDFILSFPLFTPFQVHSWMMEMAGYEGWFPSDANTEESVMYGLYWLDIGIVSTAIAGETISAGSALVPFAEILAPLGPAVAIAAIPAMTYLGAQESGPALVETHEDQAETLWGAARTALYLMFR